MNLEDTGYVEIFESSIHTMYMFQLSPSDADFSGADLSDADLSGADLSGANLSDILSSSNIDCIDTDLPDSDLCGADFTSTELSQTVIVDSNDDERYAMKQLLDLEGARINVE
jgi:uncharacterized protein YjbI with pentapeptide repeats